MTFMTDGEITTIKPAGEKGEWFVIYDNEIVSAFGERIFETSSIHGVSEYWWFSSIRGSFCREDLYETYEEAKAAFITSLEEEISRLSDKLSALKGQ